MKISIKRAVALCVIFSIILFILEIDIIKTPNQNNNKAKLDEDALLNNKVPGEIIFFNKEDDKSIKKEDTFYLKFSNTLDTYEQGGYSSRCIGIDYKFYYIFGKPFYKSQEPIMEIYYDTIWDMRNHIDRIKKEHKSTIKVLITLEPPHLRLCAFDKECIEKFNWAVSYESVADVKVGYFDPENSPFDHYHLITRESISQKLENFKEEYRAKKANHTLEPHQLSNIPLASWFCSNCETTKSNREKYIKELMKYITIDSYGKCLNNIPPIKGMGREGNYGQTKINKISSYKFNIAFENSICMDYITEKPLDALQSGTVPIYLGHPQTLKYLPEGSYIFVGDFKSPKELADHLLYLDQNDEAYFKYHEWRSDPEIIKKWHKVNNFPNKASNNLNYYMCQLFRRYQYLQNSTIPHKNLDYIPYSEKCLPQDYFI